jgi:hypothetical protein
MIAVHKWRTSRSVDGPVGSVSMLRSNPNLQIKGGGGEI